MSSNMVPENTVSKGRSAQNSRVKTGPDVFRQRQSDVQNDARLASMRNAPRAELTRVTNDQINRIGPPPPAINQGASMESGVNKPRGVGAVGNLIDAWA
ncbi:hypothetical protein [Aliidiomarina soli]|nr:hypothetical protein [Aliidiomarina soli]